MKHQNGGRRVDWGCHELLQVKPSTPGEAFAEHGNATVKVTVAIQDALVEVVHADMIADHVNDFGLCNFRTFEQASGARRKTVPPSAASPVRLLLPASITKRELLSEVASALGRQVIRLWRFSRSNEAFGRLACNLPEAPRHLLASDCDEDEDEEAVYALLTKWTLGESSGCSQQNFFRVFAEEDAPATLNVGIANFTARVFIKRFDHDLGLIFTRCALVPATESIESILQSILAAHSDAHLPATTWAVAREGSPSDWSSSDVFDRTLPGIVNGHGPVVNGDILVLCPADALGDLAALYRQRYEERLKDFRALHRREATQVGSVSFTVLCQAMDRLNIDAWRLEQLRNSISSPPVHNMLALMEMLPNLHPQFFCDACGTRELRGLRYNCLVCSDFDLCERCHTESPDVIRPGHLDGHQTSHRMMPLRPAVPLGCLSRTLAF
jgi:hypothetical protein